MTTRRLRVSEAFLLENNSPKYFVGYLKEKFAERLVPIKQFVEYTLEYNVRDREDIISWLIAQEVFVDYFMSDAVKKLVPEFYYGKALDDAVRKNKIEVVRKIYTAFPNLECDCIFRHACDTGNVELAELCRQNGADINAYHGNSLWWAAQNCMHEMLRYHFRVGVKYSGELYVGDKEVLDILEENNYPHEQYVTLTIRLLHVCKNQLEIIKKIIGYDDFCLGTLNEEYLKDLFNGVAEYSDLEVLHYVFTLDVDILPFLPDAISCAMKNKKWENAAYLAKLLIHAIDEKAAELELMQPKYRDL